MSGSNTINPHQLSNMAGQNQKNPSFSGMSQVGMGSMSDFGFDPNNMDLDAFLAEGFENNSSVNQPIAQTPTYNFDQAYTPQQFAQMPQEVVPLQQSVNPSPLSLTPAQQQLPAVPPGMAYHPDIGWYYPVRNQTMAPPAGFQAPAQYSAATPIAPMPFFPAQPAQAFTPAPSLPPVPLFSKSTPSKARKQGKTSQAGRASRGSKRKYGPAAYLDEQAKRRAEGDDSGPRPVSRDSIDFHWDSRPKAPKAVKPRIYPAKKVTPATQQGGQMKELKVATVKPCSCPAAKAALAAHIPRPRNAFIIFRSDFTARYKSHRGEKRGKSNVQNSVAAGQAWNALSRKAQEVFNRRAAEEAAEHKRLYPDYSYTPLKRIQAKFGQSDCACGAWEANIAELERLREGGPTPENNFTGATDNEASDNDREMDLDLDGEYTAPRTRSQSRADIFSAPGAQMTMGSPFDFNGSVLDGFDASQLGNDAATADWLTTLTTEGNENEEDLEPASKRTRRSPRNATKSVHYADGLNFDEDLPEDQLFAPMPQKGQPAPLLSRRSSNALSEINADDFTTSFDNQNAGPATRTRSKSISSASEMSPLLAEDDLFGQGDEADEDVGENIVVASKRPSQSGKRRRS